MLIKKHYIKITSNKALFKKS